MIAPPYAYACAALNCSRVALGNRLWRSGLMCVSHAASMIASWESTAYALEGIGQASTKTRKQAITARRPDETRSMIRNNEEPSSVLLFEPRKPEGFTASAAAGQTG